MLCGPGVAEQVEVIGPQPKPKSPPPIVDLTGPAPATPPAVAGVGGADDEMERAIQLSLKEADDREKFNQEIKGGRGYKEPENPFDRKRDSLEVPAGIKNVGNTCYINSLLQAIFMVPRFRTAILEFALVARETPGERLIHELQLLFTRMLLTERRYVDPQPLLEFTSHHGAQEDPTELFLSLLEKIREGILKHPTAKMARVSPAEDDVGTQPMDLREDVVEPDQEGSAGDLISRYFEGSCWQSVVAREEDGTPIERSTSEKFMQIICSVPQSNNLRLHDLLEHYTAVSLIDGYQTPRGHLTQARRSVMFDELPPILLIQLQRVSWTNNALQKNNAKVLFDDTMTMDR